MLYRCYKIVSISLPLSHTHNIRVHLVMAINDCATWQHIEPTTNPSEEDFVPNIIIIKVLFIYQLFIYLVYVPSETWLWNMNCRMNYPSNIQNS